MVSQHHLESFSHEMNYKMLRNDKFHGIHALQVLIKLHLVQGVLRRQQQQRPRLRTNMVMLRLDKMMMPQWPDVYDAGFSIVD